jgi:hypothetical protein
MVLPPQTRAFQSGISWVSWFLQGFEAAREVLSELLDGRTDPAIGHVIRLGA